MTDSSEKRSSDLAHVKVKHIDTLCDLLRGSTIREKQHIRRRYCEHASHFEATLQFLTSLGCVNDDGRMLSLEPDISNERFAGTVLSQELVRRLAARASPFRKQLSRYLARFCVIQDQIVYRPAAQHTKSESDLRNLLMDLGSLSHDASSNVYVLETKYRDLFAEAARPIGPVSPQILAMHQGELEAIGGAAEDVICAYERERVGRHYTSAVVHVSRTDASAGYDIASITVLSDATTIPRLIEVKAVPAGTLRFYWSANEVATARQFGCWYYLYIVPVLAGGVVDLGQLLIIGNPCDVVFNDNEWSVEPDVFRCEQNHRRVQARDRDKAGGVI